MKYFTTFSLAILFACLLPGMKAQDVLISYTVKEIHSELQQIEIAARSASSESISLKAINLSFAFDLSCAHPSGYQSIFTDAWTPYLENAKIHTELELPYRAENQSARWQYGSADPGLPATAAISLPSREEAGFPILSISMEGSCARDFYLESQQQNSLNQFADDNMKLISYEVEAHHAAAFRFLQVEANAIDAERTQIVWQTQYDEAGAYFEVEKCEEQDFAHAAVIAKEMAMPMAGGTYYQLMDEGETTALTYYRIKYVDTEGETTFSQVMEVKRATAHPALSLQASVFPNPTTDHLTVLLQGGSHQQLHLQLSDISGKILLIEEVRLDASGFEETKLDFRSFADAVYLLEVWDEEQPASPQSLRIVKQ